MLELLCHAHVGVYMKALFDEEDAERIALSCHLALDLLRNKKKMSLLRKGRHIPCCRPRHTEQDWE